MKKIKILVAVISLLVISSCRKESTPAEVSVYLHDAPAAYEKIKIHFKGVQIYSDADRAWVTLTVNNTVYDILTLDAVHPAFLGKIKINGGTISQLQLLVGTENSVTISGVEYPLILDNADLDKLKVSIKANIKNDSNYRLTIDFKASESIDASGNVYKLKASLKVTIKDE